MVAQWVDPELRKPYHEQRGVKQFLAHLPTAQGQSHGAARLLLAE
jgi:hypothetical protein